MDETRDKLIELFKRCESIVPLWLGAYGQAADHLLADKDISRAFELLKAEKEGKLILPPCKAGDKLFRIIKLTNSVYKPFVSTLPDTVEPYGIFYKGLMGECRRIPFEEFGKTVFLTREEAEKALREKENETVQLP